jgi:hypothetical protein
VPVAIPLIAAIGSVGAGVVAAGAATTIIGTVAAYATIAGGVLTGIGAVTGKKSLMKIGAVLAIGGGLATMANNWANSAATATSDAAGKVAVDATKNVVEDAAPSAAQVGTEAVPVPADVARAGGEIPGQMGGAQGYTAAGMTTPVPTGATAGLNAAPSLGLDAAAPTAANASTPLAVPNAVAPTVTVSGAPPVSVDPYQQYQSTMMEAGQRTLGGTAAESPIQQWLNKITGTVGSGLKAVGSVVKDNKELFQLGGTMLSAAYGPQAEQIDMLKAQQDRQVKNLNTPVKLYYRKG